MTSEVELLREIINIQKLQIERYDIYINSLLKNTRTNNNVLLFDKSIYENIDDKTKNIDVNNILNILEAKYPNIENLLKIYEICLERKWFVLNKKTGTIEYYDIDGIENVTMSDFANKISMYIFGKFVNDVQNSSNNSNTNNDLNYEKDNNRVQNLSMLKIKDHQIQIFKLFMK